MEPISADTIEKTLQKMEKMSLTDIQKLMDKMGEEQPYVLAYLMAIGGNSLNLDERELLVYLGTVVWQIMSQGSEPLAQVSGEILDEFEEKNWQMVEYLQGEPDADFDTTVETIFKNYPQSEVLRYVIEALMFETKEEASIREKKYWSYGNLPKDDN